MDGTALLSLLIECYQKFHLVPRSKFTGVTALGERIHVEKDTPRAPLILICNEPILEEQWREKISSEMRALGQERAKWHEVHVSKLYIAFQISLAHVLTHMK